MKRNLLLGSALTSPLKTTLQFFTAIMMLVLFLVLPPKANAAKTTLKVGGSHTYGELNLKFISSTHDVDFYSGVGTAGAMKRTDISGVSGVQQRWDVIHRVDIGGGSHKHPEVLRFAYSFNSYGVPVNPGVASNYVLMYRTSGSSSGTAWTNAGSSATVVGSDTVVFTLNIMCGYDLEFAIATKDTTNSPLPVTYLNYSAIDHGNYDEVKWATATETNNSHFEIEQLSLDTKKWVTVLNENSKSVNGNSNQNLYYLVIIPKAPDKTFYYRIKQVDFSGVFEYSQIFHSTPVSEVGKKPEIVMYPNPANQGSTVVVNAKNFGIYDGKIQVSDINGVIVFETNLEDSNTLLNLPNLTKGVYTVCGYNRNQSINKKLVVLNNNSD